MNIEDFQQLVGAYGARVELWPASRRAAATALAASEPAAATAALYEARALDAMLATAPGLPASAVLRARIAAAAPRPRAPATRRWLSALGVGAALAAACAAGAVTGVAAATRQVEPARSSLSADPADDAARYLAEPADPTAG